VVHLAEVAQTISREKRYSMRATVTGGSDEVTILVDAFNEMISEVQKRDSALREAHAELEARVQERTAQLRQSEHDLRTLSGRLIALQDEERRRIARELHDSTGQVLAAFAMNLALLRGESDKLSPNGLRAMNECLEMVKNLSRELRTMSYLLHPPLLDEAGLESALRWYIQGFAERSGIHADLDLSPSVGRLPRDMEIAVFRIVQESLTNVHRHSGSDVTTVRVARDAREVRVEVRDQGKGISGAALQKSKPGVGIQGMRERVSQLGGRFEILSDHHGTIVIATFPIPESTEASLDSSVEAGGRA
jgi:signal transduction histidine kinase